MIRDELIQAIRAGLLEIGVGETSLKPITLEHPGDISHGDYSTNVALAYAKELAMAPRAIAEKLVPHIQKNLNKKVGTKKLFSKKIVPMVTAVEVAGPGFINFRLSPEFFHQSLEAIFKHGEKFGTNDTLSGKKIIIEYTDPNPFKIFHIGHLMSNAIGEALSRIIEAHGAHVVRMNYQGDVGMHVAKAVWGMLQDEAGFPKSDASLEDMIAYINTAYVVGSSEFDKESTAKEEITVINKMLFDRSNPKLMKIYEWGRKVSLLNFEVIYRKLGTKFNHYFFESEVAGDGALIVRDFVKRGVFEESDGAVVFKGEPYGLHTRVFISSQGLPTYEAKEIGLTRVKFDRFNPDLSIVVTAAEQNDYFKVVMKALSLMFPYMADKMKHVSHGMLRFASGKMSSRKGNVITGESLLADVAELVREKMSEVKYGGVDAKSEQNIDDQIVTDIAVGAIKYSILKQAAGSDIIYDFDKSISFEGDSGPYLQYSCVRARAVIAKAAAAKVKAKLADVVVADAKTDGDVAPVTLLEKMLYRYPEVIVRAGESYEPHHVVTYLIELAAAFNHYYATTTILDTTDKATKTASAHRVAITSAFVTIMENGLNVLGIRVPEKM